MEICTRALREQLGERLSALAGADFSGPLVEREWAGGGAAAPIPPRHPEVRGAERRASSATARDALRRDKDRARARAASGGGKGDGPGDATNKRHSPRNLEHKRHGGGRPSSRGPAARATSG